MNISRSLMLLATVTSSMGCGRAGDAVIGSWNIASQTYTADDTNAGATTRTADDSDTDGGTFEFTAGDPDTGVQGVFTRVLTALPDRSQIDGGYADVVNPASQTAGWLPGGFDSDTFDDPIITVFDADTAFNGQFDVESGFGSLVLRRLFSTDYGAGSSRLETWTYTLQSQ